MTAGQSRHVAGVPGLAASVAWVLLLCAALPRCSGQDGQVLGLDCTSKTLGNLVWFCRATGTLAASAAHVYNVEISRDVSEDLSVVLTSQTGDADLCGHPACLLHLCASCNPIALMARVAPACTLAAAAEAPGHLHKQRLACVRRSGAGVRVEFQTPSVVASRFAILLCLIFFHSGPFIAYPRWQEGVRCTLPAGVREEDFHCSKAASSGVTFELVSLRQDSVCCSANAATIVCC